MLLQSVTLGFLLIMTSGLWGHLILAAKEFHITKVHLLS